MESSLFLLPSWFFSMRSVEDLSGSEPFCDAFLRDVKQVSDLDDELHEPELLPLVASREGMV